MAGRKRDDKRPRRAQSGDTSSGRSTGSDRPGSAPQDPATERHEPRSQQQSQQQSTPSNQSDSERVDELNTAATVDAARRAERLAELRQIRDATADAPPPSKADRPDFGKRPNSAAADTTDSGHRGRRGALIAALAVIVIAAVVATVVIWGGREGVPAANVTPTPSAAPVNTSLVTGDVMLTPKSAARVIDRKWKIDTDQPADAKNAAVPACLAIDTDEALQPKESMVRTLTSTSKGPTALHRAQAFETPELATEAFALMAKALGECNLKGSYIESGREISGLGDQATGVVLNDPSAERHRTVLVNRTGRMVNVIDMAAGDETPDPTKLADQLRWITDAQCTSAIGICASDPTVEEGPPPIGGDQPGFLAVADIPLPRNGKGAWGGLDPGSPADVVTSGCENVQFGDVPADNRVARSYVLADNPKGMPNTFGLDQITLSMASDDDAEELADQIASSIRDCEDRLPTAETKQVSKISGIGADDTEIKGITATVEQQVTSDETSVYRVGIVSAGSKVVYTFLPTDGDWDLTRSQFEDLTVRAGERATQVR